MSATVAQGPDLEAAFKVETSLTLVDHEGLGIIVSELTSEQQADFLTGLAEGWSRFSDASARGLQCAYIADEFKATPGLARGVAGLLRDLAEHIEAAS